MKIPDFPLLAAPASNDLLLGWNEATQTTRRILLSSIINTNQARLIKSNATANKIDTLICDNRSGDITVTVPLIGNGETGILDIACISSLYKVYLNFSGAKFKGQTITSPAIAYMQSSYKSTRLVYLDNSLGWAEINNNLINYFAPYQSGMKLWIEAGSTTDKSGNSNNATLLGSISPSVAVGIDDRQVLRWSGSGNQELQISPFLAGKTTAALYCIFSVTANTNYSLIRTANIDDYWRFTTDGNGYFGTFLSSRRTSYPTTMPSSGNHLVSIHAGTSTYEVLLNNASKGVQSVGFSAGDRFRIVTNDKPFNGDIALILVYPELITPTSTQHQSIVSAIKSNYPSLPFSL